MQKITPFLWFNNNAEEAIAFYCAVFKEAKSGAMTRYGKEGPGPEGQVMTASFTLFGQEFTVLNGGPHFKFTEAVSFVVNCESQEEVDYYWEKLTEGGQPSQCGWLKDKFGLSWQIVPTALPTILSTGTAKQKSNAMQAMMKMGKLDIATLQKAHDEAA